MVLRYQRKATCAVALLALRSTVSVASETGKDLGSIGTNQEKPALRAQTCWKDAFQHFASESSQALSRNDGTTNHPFVGDPFQSPCAAMTIEQRRQLALEITSCHMSASGRPISLEGCTRGSTHAVLPRKNSTNGGGCLSQVAFGAYTQFYNTMELTCTQLSYEWSSQLDEVSRASKDAARKASKDILGINEVMDVLEERQAEVHSSVEKAGSSLAQGQNNLESSISKIHDQFRSVNEKGKSSLSEMEKMRDVITPAAKLAQDAATGEALSLRAIALAFVISTNALWVLTAAGATRGSRPYLLLVATLHALLETWALVSHRTGGVDAAAALSRVRLLRAGAVVVEVALLLGAVLRAWFRPPKERTPPPSSSTVLGMHSANLRLRALIAAEREREDERLLRMVRMTALQLQAAPRPSPSPETPQLCEGGGASQMSTARSRRGPIVSPDHVSTARHLNSSVVDRGHCYDEAVAVGGTIRELTLSVPRSSPRDFQTRSSDNESRSEGIPWDSPMSSNDDDDDGEGTATRERSRRGKRTIGDAEETDGDYSSTQGDHQTGKRQKKQK